MEEEQWPPDNLSEGTASLQVAQAYLSTLLGAVEGLDNKAMFLSAINIALYTVFAGVLVRSESPIWLWLPGLVVASGILGLTWSMLRPRSVEQFPLPEMILANRDAGFGDNTLAWEYVSAIHQATLLVRELQRVKVRALRWMAYASVVHAIALISCALLWYQISG